ncbi:hypothetical protein QTP70_024657 [Hemibagrus guttatus]|uniref:TNFR-Cys domain-containing protein n=1 Tax=Hemibagrus guttatus TaxID=175788 RepID=A0AAE0VCU1_9TELE|nr:hypothetical protein QTP70_024657 [Hemibagrus guttatus]
MLCQSSYFIWSFMSLLTLYQVHVASEITCQPGERVTRSKTSCEPCPTNQYNPKASKSTECRNCEPCGLGFLAVFLLLILILKLFRCPEEKIGIVRQGSECGKPVEESGEKFIPTV